MTICTLHEFPLGVDPNDATPKSNAAAEKALEFDPTLARPHAVLGANHMQRDWNLSGSEAESRKALEHLHARACELAIAAKKAIATSLKAKRSFTVK